MKPTIEVISRLDWILTGDVFGEDVVVRIPCVGGIAKGWNR